MYRYYLLLAMAVLFVGQTQAQINPGGIVNAASYRFPDLPNGKIAPASIAAVFGQDLSSPGFSQNGSFPLAFTVGGTSGKVTVGGTTLDIIPLWTSTDAASRQSVLAIVVPSATPEGVGTLTLNTPNGMFTAPIEIGAHSPGVFSLTQQGSGGAVVQKFEGQGNAPSLVTLRNSLVAGDVAIVWFTGAGGVAGVDPAAEAAGNARGRLLNLDIQVYLGGMQLPPQNILGVASSGCCVGVNQMNILIPPDKTGCYLPLVVVIDGVPSNFVTLPVAASGSVCSQDGVFDGDELTQFLSGAEVSFGSVNMTRVTNSFSIPEGVAQSIEFVSDSASANFDRFAPRSFEVSSPPIQFSTIGACLVFQFSGESADFEEAAEITPLNAGTITLSGPPGMSEIPQTETGSYFKSYSQPLIPGFPTQFQPPMPYFTAGNYTFTGTGGSGVGPFTTSRNFSGGITWTNRADITTVDRSQDLLVTWSGGNASQENAWIFGASFSTTSFNPEQTVGAAFFCQPPLAPGQYPIPAAVLSSLPASQVVSAGQALSAPGAQQDIAIGILQVGSIAHPQRFEASGLDYGTFMYTVLSGTNVSYE